MRRAETVKEVYKRHLARDGRKVCNRRKIHNFLHVAFCKHGKTGLASSHNIGMITKDIKSMRSYGTGAHMKYRRKTLCSNLVHIRNHKEQALGSGIGGGKSTSTQRSVNRTSSTALGLHLYNIDRGSKDVFKPARRPLIYMICHGARRRNGINTCDFRKSVRHPCGGLIAVHGFEFSRHFLSLEHSEPLVCKRHQ